MGQISGVYTRVSNRKATVMMALIVMITTPEGASGTNKGLVALFILLQKQPDCSIPCFAN